MKLTKRGRDYLKACLASTLVATVLDTKIVLALCLALVFAALISGLILAGSSNRDIEIRPENERVSCYKGDEVRVTLVIKSQTRRFLSISLSSLHPPKGIEADVERANQDNFEVVVRPRFAGRFVGFSATFELNDPLRLYAKEIQFVAKTFVVDCYPASILREASRARPTPISLGEREGRTQGLGLEFYATDRYTSSVERKNIFWRKVASLSDERLMVITRTANIQKTIAISLIITTKREDHLEWIDSACEGVAIIGKTILEIGCEAKINFDYEGKIVSREIANLKELSETIMDMSIASPSYLENASSLLAKGDIYVVGFIELQNSLLASAVARKPALLIQDDGEIPSGISELTMIYKPFEDLGKLVGSVTGK